MRSTRAILLASTLLLAGTSDHAVQHSKIEHVVATTIDAAASYRSKPHRPQSQHTIIDEYLTWITPKDPAIVRIGERIVGTASTREEAAQRIVTYVRRLATYQEDPKGTEHFRYPLETIVERVADCEDYAFLAASILASRGYDTAIVVFPETPTSEGHVGIAIAGEFPGTPFVHDGKRYFYAEVTGTRTGALSPFAIGTIPPSLPTTAYVLPVPTKDVQVST